MYLLSRITTSANNFTYLTIQCEVEFQLVCCQCAKINTKSVNKQVYVEERRFTVVKLLNQVIAMMTDVNSLENNLKEEFETFSIAISRDDVMDRRKIFLPDNICCEVALKRTGTTGTTRTYPIRLWL